MGMVVYLWKGLRSLGGVYAFRWFYHIGVGFCVARSTEMGSAKASNRGTGDGTDSHAFFV
jgi:hypothetical protein